MNTPQPRQRNHRSRTSGRRQTAANNQQPRIPEQHPVHGTEIELSIDRIAHGGFGVARTTEGRVVFVADSIPGERVRVKITDASNKSFWRADTVEVLEPSPHRVEHFWTEARLDRAPEDRAGGADFGHISLAYQRALKEDVLRDSLQRFGKLSDAEIASPNLNLTVQPLVDDSGLGWRTRIRLHVNDRGELGVFSPRSHSHIPVTTFPLATRELLENAPLGQLFEGATTISLVHTATDQYSITIDDIPSKQPLTELAHTKYDADGKKATAEPRRFQLAPDGFWQVHRNAPNVLAQHTVSLINRELFVPDAHNLDLYSGVGLFTAAIADSFDPAAHIHTVESDETATKYASQNLADLPNVETFSADVLRFLQHRFANADSLDFGKFAKATVLLDPPRSGAGKQVIQALGRLAPQQIIYVACDPVALSRDIALLAEQGYRLEQLFAFDLFPNTHHFETLAAFTRA